MAKGKTEIDKEKLDVQFGAMILHALFGIDLLGESE